MTFPFPPRLVLLLGLTLALPARAQAFADGTPFGGSAVFSEGLDPRSNPARFDRVPEGFYLGFEAGDLKPWSTSDASDSLRDALTAGDAAAEGRALLRLAARPWATRRRAFGLQWAMEGGVRFAYQHEDLRGSRAEVDLAHLGGALGTNGTQVQGFGATVDRLLAAVGSAAGPSGVGLTARLERVRSGREDFALVPGAGQAALTDPAEALQGRVRDRSTWTFSTDLGATRELNDWIRAGLTLDRLLPRRFGEVNERPQFRAGFQFDLTPLVQFSVEGDLNAAARLPLPQKQRVLAASLRVEGLVRVVSFTFGAERRSLEGARSTLVGAAVHVRTAPLLWSLGLQLGDDRPLMAGGFRFGR
ncbi:MAG TPA: hypothetical protein VJ623_09605 [Holophagaceae bacterium]|nr:hypothetical protein [Holophagaceae bacterium]